MVWIDAAYGMFPVGHVTMFTQLANTTGEKSVPLPSELGTYYFLGTFNELKGRYRSLV